MDSLEQVPYTRPGYAVLNTGQGTPTPRAI